jgi:hypothetical protein
MPPLLPAQTKKLQRLRAPRQTCGQEARPTAGRQGPSQLDQAYKRCTRGRPSRRDWRGCDCVSAVFEDVKEHLPLVDCCRMWHAHTCGPHSWKGRIRAMGQYHSVVEAHTTVQLWDAFLGVCHFRICHYPYSLLLSVDRLSSCCTITKGIF